jgi:hypothetical protein
MFIKDGSQASNFKYLCSVNVSVKHFDKIYLSAIKIQPQRKISKERSKYNK